MSKLFGKEVVEVEKLSRMPEKPEIILGTPLFASNEELHTALERHFAKRFAEAIEEEEWRIHEAFWTPPPWKPSPGKIAEEK